MNNMTTNGIKQKYHTTKREQNIHNITDLMTNCFNALTLLSCGRKVNQLQKAQRFPWRKRTNLSRI